MASLITCAFTSVITGVTWCFCTASASLLGACCGNDKPSTLPPSVTSGRKRSVLLLLICIVLALAFQYGVAPAIIDAPEYLTYLRDPWLDGCTNLADASLTAICVGNAGAFRPSFAAGVFFVLAAVAAACKPSANREAWPAKFVLYLFGVAAMIFVPNEPLFTPIYLNLARIGGVLFIFVQQIIIVDVAYNWNDSWVDKANKAEAEEPGSGRKWLAAILIACGLMFAAALGGLIYMFVAFTGCGTNNAFIAVTLILCLAVTGAQLSGEEGSLLASASMSAWAVYLLYSAVTKNPNAACNPMLGENTPSNIVLGLLVTMISLGWTGWSYTAEDKLQTKKEAEQAADQAEAADEEKPKVTGVAVGGDDDDEDAEEDPAASDSSQLSNSWRLNVILAVVAAWQAMILTHWGSIATKGDVANPSVGQVAMWMVIASQWLVMVLYVWTLVAPRLFPDRDFS